MTIRYLAEELYRWTREVENLEKALAALGPTGTLEERNRLDQALRQASSSKPISGPCWNPKRSGPGYNFCRNPSKSPPPRPRARSRLHPKKPLVEVV